MNEEDKNIIKYACGDSSSCFWSSSSSSDFDLEIGDFLEPRNKLVRIKSFLEVTDKYSDEEFRRHFRLDRSTANLCIDQLNADTILSEHRFGREKVCAKKAFQMTIWYLANRETYRQLSDRFDVTESTAWRIVNKVINHLVTRSSSIIKWPNEEEAARIDEEFSTKQGIKGVIGAIDGSHILINRKGPNQYAYCNRKGQHSVIIQGVVDDKKRFIDVFVGEPGSLHDARVLRRSALYHRATEGTLQFNNRFLLGDSAYPTTLHWLVTPFTDNGQLTQQQRTFNYKHSSTRVIVENAFGLLKGRFRRLRYFENKNIEFAVKSVIAACTLHNICINNDENLNDIDLYIMGNNDGDQDSDEEVVRADLQEGTTRREQVFRDMNL